MQNIIKLVHTHTGRIDADQVKAACQVLDNGGILAIPTDTIYGLAARADDSKALKKIYSIKGRDLSKPLSVCLRDTESIQNVAIINETQRKLINLLLPGPVTILLERSESLNKDLNPGIKTVGVRVPDHNFIKVLCNYVGPLALTSANRSGEIDPIKIHDFENIWDKIDCIYDEGCLQRWILDASDFRHGRLGSTVVDLVKPKTYKIIRQGMGLNRTINIIERFGYRHVK